MAVLQRVVKPRTQRGKRALEHRQPKAVENVKRALFLRGPKSSDMAMKFLKDIFQLKKPFGMMFSRKHEVRPFEDINPIERFSSKYDCSLFFYAAHSKKRPHNVVFGRMFDGHLLDMIELGIEKYKAMGDFKTPKISPGNKPCLLFIGEKFQQDSVYQRMQNLLVDLFSGQEVSWINLQGIEQVFIFSAVGNLLLIRNYRINLKKSEGKIPKVELEEMGPSVDLILRRTHLGSDTLFNSACKKPKQLKAKKIKNISEDSFGSKLGRIHMPSQDIAKLQTRKMKGLKKSDSSESDKFQRKSGRKRRAAAATASLSDANSDTDGEIGKHARLESDAEM